ncbi:beta-beta-carotene 9'-10'-dioxygenase [Apiospora phragmitis]|uniref:Beta-beta-carotene 9'-10'-dioxygenase n=1 Tax=Apiospora phragmitis TaxID=2905665 RepID=A0ABR1T8V2_9PEZI
MDQFYHGRQGTFPRLHYTQHWTAPMGPALCTRDPETGDYFSFSLEPEGVSPTYRIFQVSTTTGSSTISPTLFDVPYADAALHHLATEAKRGRRVNCVKHSGIQSEWRMKTFATSVEARRRQETA